MIHLRPYHLFPGGSGSQIQIALLTRAPDCVEHVPKGARPDDLAVQRLIKFILVVNFKTAKAAWHHDATVDPFLGH